MGWVLIDRGMLIGQIWHSVMDVTYQSRVSPLDRKHFDKYSSWLMCDCINMQEVVTVVCIFGGGECLEVNCHI